MSVDNLVDKIVELQEQIDKRDSVIMDQDNETILKLFRDSGEANFTRFLDNYEYVSEVTEK